MGADARKAPLGLEPGGVARGTCTPPPSKSEAQRCLVAAALAAGTTRIAGLGGPGPETLADDVAAARDVCVELSRDGTRLEVGESGLLARLATAAAALCLRAGVPVLVTGRGSLARRRSPALFEALRGAGAGIAFEGVDQGWPVRITPVDPPPIVRLARPGSSQEVSALLLALAAGGPAYLHVEGDVPSRPYVDLTIRVLARFGASVVEGEEPGGRLFEIGGPLVAPEGSIELEPDASGAAVALAAACLSGGALRVPGLAPDSAQGDGRVVEHLRAFGCVTRQGADGLEAGGRPTRGARVELGATPDLAPVLAAVAADVALRTGQSSVLEGLHTLPGKESDRLEGLARALAGLGLEVGAEGDRMRIGPGAGGAAGAELVIDPRGDHRMAFAGALLGLVRPGVRVRDAGCVAKSWPAFWADMRDLGLRVAGP